uniref:Uncharacterized protein n=1 Tax=Oryza meridionalis TaxID=40149 RepID=A0A0E0CWD5_9ORYZ
MNEGHTAADARRAVPLSALAALAFRYCHSANAPIHGGSVIGHEVVDRNREARHLRLCQDYFSDNPTYGPAQTHKKIRDNETHYQLREDLVEHLWQHYPDKY